MLCSLQASQFYTAIYLRGVLLHLIKDIYNEKLKKMSIRECNSIFYCSRYTLEVDKYMAIFVKQKRFSCIHMRCRSNVTEVSQSGISHTGKCGSF